MDAGEVMVEVHFLEKILRKLTDQLDIWQDGLQKV